MEDEEMMDFDWTEKYRPSTLKDVVGNSSQLEAMRKWAEMWAKGVPKKRALIVDGPPGVGKTSSALALAKDMGWPVVEVNASDTRNAASIKDIVERGAMFDTFTLEGNFVSHKMGGYKLIVIDEADNLFGNEDRGGSSEIVKVVRKTRQPIILIVNDYYQLTSRSKGIQFMTERVRFSRLRKTSVVRVLESVCSAEGISATAGALDIIAENAKGDIRSAIKDLMALGMGMERLTEEDLLALSYREREESVFDLLALTFKGTDSKLMREKLYLVDETPDSLLLWYDENLPLQYKKPDDLCRGFDALSRADIYLFRVYKRQNYALWGYANDMMTEGILKAKNEPYTSFSKLEFPTWLKKMSSSKAKRALRRSVAKKLGNYIHLSKREVEKDFLDYFSALLKSKSQLQIGMAKELDLTAEELGLIIGKKPDSSHVKKVIEEAERMASNETAPTVFDSYNEENVEQDTKDEVKEESTQSQKSLFDF
ncbi:MAG TPA: replication factor C large subunit [Euryarchaeota archaeon]|nr:replication factor C large subunit [Euryarchaeota archaeon]